jgi:hypothetical protein
MFNVLDSRVRNQIQLMVCYTAEIVYSVLHTKILFLAEGHTFLFITIPIFALGPNQPPAEQLVGALSSSIKQL